VFSAVFSGNWMLSYGAIVSLHSVETPEELTEPIYSNFIRPHKPRRVNRTVKNNNMVERLHGTMRERSKVVRGLEMGA